MWSERSRWVNSQQGKDWLEVVGDDPKTIKSCLVVSGWELKPTMIAVNFDLQASGRHRFRDGFSAFWARAVRTQETKTTVIFDYR